MAWASRDSGNEFIEEGIERLRAKQAIRYTEALYHAPDRIANHAAWTEQ